jgi:tetratricopeptide (TPR) repeat protein
MAWLGNLRAALAQFLSGSSVAVPPAHERTVSVGASVNNSQIFTGDIVNNISAADTPRALSSLRQLPADVPDFTGRAPQMQELLAALNTPAGRVAISAIDGMGGLGKTMLAVHVAHRLTGRYPDAQIVVDMAGTSAAPLTAEQGLARVIRAFEPQAPLPEAVTELRPTYLSILRGKRVLLILDNAHDGNQVTPLLPPEDCALIVTSRRRIAVAGLARIDLDLLAPEEAVDLLRSIIGNDRAAPTELSRIAELCGLLPLALRVAGMFLHASPHWSADRFIVALADERKRLGRLKLEGSADLDVAASLALSVRHLRRTHPDIVDRWHQLAVFPTSFDAAGAAGVWDQPQEAADDALGVLLSRSMVLYDPAQQRWWLHDLMRDLAGGHVATDAFVAPADLATRLTVARQRHAEHYCGLLAAAGDLYIKGGAHVLSGLALFDRERRNIEEGQAWAAADIVADPARARLCVRYPLDGVYVLSLRQHPRQSIAWLEHAATAAPKIGDRSGEGAVLNILGDFYAQLGETRRAIEFLEQSLAIAQETGNPYWEAPALAGLGVAYAALGDTRRAEEHYEQALAILREIGDRRGEGKVLGNLGRAYANLGETRRAIEFYEHSLVIARERGDLRDEGKVLGNLGRAYVSLGETCRAAEHHEQALAITREIGDRHNEGAALWGLGLAYADLGDTRRAAEHYEQALAITGHRQSAHPARHAGQSGSRPSGPRRDAPRDRALRAFPRDRARDRRPAWRERCAGQSWRRLCAPRRAPTHPRVLRASPRDRARDRRPASRGRYAEQSRRRLCAPRRASPRCQVLRAGSHHSAGDR